MAEDRDQAIRDVVKGASVVYVGLFLELLIAFVAQVLAARYLSVGDFGGLTAGTALLDVGSIVGGLGLASGLTRYLPRIGDAQKRMLSISALAVALVTSIALGAAVAANASFIATQIFGSPNVAVSIRIFGAAIPFAAILNVAIGGIRGQERSLYRVYVKNIIHPLARFALVIGAVVYGLDQAGLAGAYALPYVLSAAVALYLLHRALPRARSSFDDGLFAEFTRYSLPFTVTKVSNFVFRSIDVFIVLYFLGDGATGIYGVAYAAVSFMRIFSTAFNFLGSPIASKLESDGSVDDVLDMFSTISRWLVIASVCTLVPLGIFSTEFITLIYSTDYANGGQVLLILAIGFATANVLNIHSPILQAVGRSKTLSFNSGLAAVTNVVLNFLLIPRVGITGAAIATVISYFLRDGLATVQVRYLLKSTPITNETVRPALVAVPFLAGFAVFVAPRVPTTVFWLVAATVLFAVAYVGTVLAAFGLSDTDVMLIRSAEEKYDLDLGSVDGLIDRLSER